MMYRFIDFEIKGDCRGSLITLENNSTIPFNIKRVYYLFNTKKGVRRGFHAHKKLEQIIISISGSCKIFLDNGLHREVVLLNRPDRGLFLKSLIWREIYDFSKDCILLVLANEYYDESDYIRDYNEFLKEIENG
jgi:dTDP-4-dehydrorhamnose 3,5-epimerase-like enzyme